MTLFIPNRLVDSFSKELYAAMEKYKVIEVVVSKKNITQKSHSRLQ